MLDKMDDTQVADTTLAVGEPGSENQAPAAAVTETQPGATSEAAAPRPPVGRTYSETDYRALQAAKDREIAERDAYLQQAQFQDQLARVVQAEQAAQAQDREQVEAGSMTVEEARQRYGLRAEIAAQTQQATHLRGINQQVAAQAEKLAYVVAAHDMAATLGKEEGLSNAEQVQLVEELMSGPRVATPSQMQAKAERILRLRHKARQASAENYDTGPGRGSGMKAIDQMSPEEKVSYGLRQKR